jgi:alkylhydroperoxidase family enzyme
LHSHTNASAKRNEIPRRWLGMTYPADLRRAALVEPPSSAAGIVSLMARLDYPDLGAADSTAQATAERIRQERGGRLLNLFRMQLYNPAIASAWLDLGSAVRFKSELDSPTRELEICLVSRITGAEYEWRSHRRLAIAEGFAEGQLDDILNWRTSEAFDQRQRAVLGLAEELTRSVKISDATFEAVKDALTARQVVEVVATCAYYNMVARFLVGLEIDLEG